MLRSLCWLCGQLSTQSLSNQNGHISAKHLNDSRNAPAVCGDEGKRSNTTSPRASTAPLVDVDALLKEAAAVMKQQSDTSGHGNSHSLSLVPFRTLLSEIQLEERLGSGAGGTTWKCRWRTTTVAIKIMVSTSVDQLRASTREAVCSRIVSHPCVVQCYAINITRLTEQDMDMLAAAASPQVAAHGGGRGEAGSNPQASQLCLCTSPQAALTADNIDTHSQPLYRHQQQHHLGPGWVLAQEGGPSAAVHTQESLGLHLSQAAEAVVSAQELRESNRLQANTTCAALVTESDMEEDAAAARLRTVGSSTIGAQLDTAVLAMAGTASAPPLSPMFISPDAATDPVDSAGLLLQAAAGAALSDSLERALGHSQTDCEAVDMRGRRLALMRQEHQQPKLQQSPGFCLMSTKDRDMMAGVAAGCLTSGCAVGPDSALAAATAEVAAAALPADLPLGWAFSNACWNDGTESLPLELDPGDQAAVLRDELLRMGAAPGKFLTTITMEWCDGGTLHHEFTVQPSQPGRLGLRQSGLASGHLLRGLGPVNGGSGASGNFNEAMLGGRSCRGLDQLDGNHRRGSGADCAIFSSGPNSLCCPAYISESAFTMYSGASLRTFCGQAGCVARGGAAAIAGSPPGLQTACSCSRTSMPALTPSPSLPAPRTGGGVGVAEGYSGQQPHLSPFPSGRRRPSGQVTRVPAASFGSFMMLQSASENQQQQQQMYSGPPSAAAAVAAVPGAVVDAYNGGSGSTAASPSAWDARSGHTAVLLRCALEVAQGMSYLHSLNLAHGDLTPKNVLLKSTATSRRGFTCKISDFGLSNPTSTGNGPPSDTSRWGTLVYMAPEVLTGRGNLKQADVYSFGAVLWHMCTGRPPHQELRPAQILVGLATGDLQLVWPDWVDPGVTRIGKACMDPDPSKRPQFEEIVRMLLAEIGARSWSARRRAMAEVRTCSATHCFAGIPAASTAFALSQPVCVSPAKVVPATTAHLTGSAAAVSPPMAGILPEGHRPPTSALRFLPLVSSWRSVGSTFAGATAAQNIHPTLTPQPLSMPRPQPPNHSNHQHHQQSAGGCLQCATPQPYQATSLASQCCEWHPVEMPLTSIGSDTSCSSGGLTSGHSAGSNERDSVPGDSGGGCSSDSGGTRQ